jgi:hypothetical protein
VILNCPPSSIVKSRFISFNSNTYNIAQNAKKNLWGGGSLNNLFGKELYQPQEEESILSTPVVSGQPYLPLWKKEDPTSPRGRRQPY